MQRLPNSRTVAFLTAVDSGCQPPEAAVPSQRACAPKAPNCPPRTNCPPKAMSYLEKLETARRKLQEADIPFQIRAVSYLRLSCFALDSEGAMYESFMRVLFSYDSQWWQKCEVTAAGVLQSSDARVTNLLRPITELHQPKAGSVAMFSLSEKQFA